MPTWRAVTAQPEVTAVTPHTQVVVCSLTHGDIHLVLLETAIATAKPVPFAHREFASSSNFQSASLWGQTL